MFEQIIKNYYKTLNLHKLGITSQSSVQDVARACVEKAFIDSIVNSAGRIWGITHYTDEVEEVKTLVSSEVCRYLNSDPNTYTHNQLHSYLIHTITENCFKKYNSDRANSSTGRKVGYTVGNAQKIINMTFKDIMAHYVSIGNSQYNEHFKSCHMPFDSIIYGYIKNTVIPDLLNAGKTSGAEVLTKLVKTPWSLNHDYELYRDTQGTLSLYLGSSNKYAGCTLLEAEFDIWNTTKTKNLNLNLNKKHKIKN